MPKLYASSAIVKILLRNGFVLVSQKGSHAKFKKESATVLTVIVPVAKKEIPYGTYRSILRQSKLSEEDFKNQ